MKQKPQFITSPVISGDFNPKFYWTGIPFEDSKRINHPHIKKEGPNEDRIAKTLELINTLSDFKEFELKDCFNIQNELLKENNWRGIIGGLRTHEAKVSNNPVPVPSEIAGLIEQLFPVQIMPKEDLLEWYKQVQLIHPLSDLNGRVFGIIVSVLYSHTIAL